MFHSVGKQRVALPVSVCCCVIYRKGVRRRGADSVSSSFYCSEISPWTAKLNHYLRNGARQLPVGICIPPTSLRADREPLRAPGLALPSGKVPSDVSSPVTLVQSHR